MRSFASDRQTYRYFYIRKGQYKANCKKIPNNSELDNHEHIYLYISDNL